MDLHQAVILGLPGRRLGTAVDSKGLIGVSHSLERLMGATTDSDKELILMSFVLLEVDFDGVDVGLRLRWLTADAHGRS